MTFADESIKPFLLAQAQRDLPRSSTATEARMRQQEASAKMEMLSMAMRAGVVSINYIKPPRKHVDSRVVEPKQLPAGKESDE